MLFRSLEDLRGRADVVLDTTDLNVHELRDLVRDRVGQGSAEGHLLVSVVSFGYKHGVPVDVDLVFDVRFLPNPHWVDELRPLTGSDPEVREFVLGQPEAAEYLAELGRLFRLTLPAYQREGKSYLTIAIGCTGGRHRSVAIAEAVARSLGELGYEPTVRHRDRNRD